MDVSWSDWLTGYGLDGVVGNENTGVALFVRIVPFNSS